MATKKLVVELEFEEVQDEDWTSLELVRISRTHTDLTEGELSELGEHIAQTDVWQVDRWIDLQLILGGSAETIEVDS